MNVLDSFSLEGRVAIVTGGAGIAGKQIVRAIAEAGAHTYVAPIHPRDIEHPQFPWTFQRYLYDCLHDYVVELFLHTPQSRDEGA